MNTFTKTVAAFMCLDLYPELEQIEIIGRLIKEPIMQSDALGVALELACRYRTTKRYDLLSQLCQVTGIQSHCSIYYQETVHVFQKAYLSVGRKLLDMNGKIKNKSHRIPNALVARFENENYQGLSMKKLLNVVYHILESKNCLNLLIDELTDAQDSCFTGFLTRVINSVLPLLNFGLESYEYEVERLRHLFTKYLSNNNITDQDDIVFALGKYASEFKKTNPDFMILVLEQYTSLMWIYLDGCYLCAEKPYNLKWLTQ